MKPYNIKFKNTNKWVDLDHVLEIDEPTRRDIFYYVYYRMMFNDKVFSIGCHQDNEKEFYNECYLPFLEAWKNKDNQNESN